jgi:hypothetical protein
MPKTQEKIFITLNVCLYVIAQRKPLIRPPRLEPQLASQINHVIRT